MKEIIYESLRAKQKRIAALGYEVTRDADGLKIRRLDGKDLTTTQQTQINGAL